MVHFSAMNGRLYATQLLTETQRQNQRTGFTRGGRVAAIRPFAVSVIGKQLFSAGWKNKVGTIANNFTFGRGSGDKELQEG